MDSKVSYLLKGSIYLLGGGAYGRACLRILVESIIQPCLISSDFSE
jgi:hypothetical protein